jgi:iron(III) transport system substrate-binding protein
MNSRFRALRGRSVAVAAVAVALVAAGCGSGAAPSAGLKTDGGWDAVVEAAKAEGAVSFYTSLDPDQSSVLEAAFEKAYPDIDATFARGASNEMISRLDQERENKLPGADVAIVTAGQWYDQRSAAGELIDPKTMPNAAKWTTEPAAGYMKNGYVGVELIPVLIAWNPQLVTQPITGYDDLLRPDLKGKLGTLDLVSPTVSAWYAHLEQTYGADYLQKLSTQGLRLYQSTTPLAQATVAGEVGVDLFAPGGIFQQYEAQGAKIETVVPDPAAATEMWAGGLKYATHPNAAAVFVDFLMGVDGQIAMNGDQGGISPLGTAAVPGSIDATPISLGASGLSQDQLNAIAARVKPILAGGSGA